MDGIVEEKQVSTSVQKILGLLPPSASMPIYLESIDNDTEHYQLQKKKNLRNLFLSLTLLAWGGDIF